MTSKLSVHEWALASKCPTRALHAKAHLPRSDNGSFGAWMKAERARIHALSRHLFPDASRIAPESPAEAEVQSRELLSVGVSVAGARLSTDTLQCDADYIVPDIGSKKIRLYQVACQSSEGPNFRSGMTWLIGGKRVPRKEWRGHLLSLTFRMLVIADLWPDFEVLPFLVVPVKGKPTTIEGLPGRLDSLQSNEIDQEIMEEAPRLLAMICVREECGPLKAEVLRSTADLLAWLRNPTPPLLGYECKGCSFRTGAAHDGFERCWGSLSRVTPHMFDLAWMYWVQDDGKPIANRLAREKRVSLWDIPENRITGEHAARQRMQIQATKSQREVINPRLRDEMNSVSYPLHFLDIESIQPILPCHRGPQGRLELFQLSVHRRLQPGGELEHIEWLNTERSSPNRSFLASLRNALGETGTVLC